LEQADTNLREALRVKEGLFGPEHFGNVGVLAHLGRLHQAKGDHQAAANWVQRSLLVAETALGPDNSAVVAPLLILASLAGDEPAEPLLRRAHRVATQKLPLGDRDRDAAVNALAALLRRTGRPEEAGRLLEPPHSALATEPGPASKSGAFHTMRL
jgi:hypothetical protein